MLQAESGTDPQMDLELIRERMDIRRALQSGDVEKAIDLVNDLNPEVRCAFRWGRCSAIRSGLIGLSLCL